MLANKCRHTDRPVKAKGLCGACYNKHLGEQNPEIYERSLARARARWHNVTKHSDPVELAANRRSKILKHRYGIKTGEYDAMSAAQSHVCAICKKPPRSRSMSVDHNHASGAVRGLLCQGCNMLVGALENPLAKAARSYLAFYGAAS